MRIHLLSDIHLETRPLSPHPDAFEPEVLDAHVTILAGDIAQGAQAVHWAHDTFAGNVLLVSGNHEHWGGVLQDTTCQQWAAGSPRVRCLEQEEVIWGGVRFLGATCWTDYAALGNVALAQWDAARSMRDFERIQIRDPAGPVRSITPQDILAINQRTKHWLRQRLATPFDGKTVVITHHAPLELCGHPRHAQPGRYVNAAYTNHWPELLGAPVDLWVYGHTHHPVDEVICGTRVVSNPVGYPGEHTGYDPRKIIEL